MHNEHKHSILYTSVSIISPKNDMRQPSIGYGGVNSATSGSQISMLDSEVGQPLITTTLR